MINIPVNLFLNLDVLIWGFTVPFLNVPTDRIRIVPEFPSLFPRVSPEEQDAVAEGATPGICVGLGGARGT